MLSRVCGAASSRADPRALLPAERLAKGLGRGDEALGAGVALEERERRLDLRAHAAGRELAVLCVLLQLADANLLERPCGGLIEVDHHLVDGRQDDEASGSEVSGEERREPRGVASGDPPGV